MYWLSKWKRSNYVIMWSGKLIVRRLMAYCFGGHWGYSAWQTAGLSLLLKVVWSYISAWWSSHILVDCLRNLWWSVIRTKVPLCALSAVGYLHTKWAGVTQGNSIGFKAELGSYRTFNQNRKMLTEFVLHLILSVDTYKNTLNSYDYIS